MPTTVKGVIARAENQPAELVDIVIPPDPGPHDVIVDVEAPASATPTSPTATAASTTSSPPSCWATSPRAASPWSARPSPTSRSATTWC